MSTKAIRHLWPLSPQHKQLVALVLGAIWVSVATLYAVEGSHGTASFREMRAITYSAPGVLFAGIGFWWFGRRVIVKLF